jgi:hypothetical protein
MGRLRRPRPRQRARAHRDEDVASAKRLGGDVTDGAAPAHHREELARTTRHFCIAKPLMLERDVLFFVSKKCLANTDQCEKLDV